MSAQDVYVVGFHYFVAHLFEPNRHICFPPALQFGHRAGSPRCGPHRLDGPRPVRHEQKFLGHVHVTVVETVLINTKTAGWLGKSW